jgi:nicotinamidase-related amidase
MAKTLFELAGANPSVTPLSKGVLVLIDIQNEYFEGPLKLSNVETASEVAAGLLKRARSAGTPVIHIRHNGKPGGAFDPEAHRGAIHESVAPIDGETVIDKSLPNAYAGTNLAEALAEHPDRQPIFVGHMTHMCLSATTRAALDHGALATIVVDATATRDLPNPMGGIVPASAVHSATIAALSDRFAVPAKASEIPD